MPDWWTVPREWEGEACFILGGGPSLQGFDVERLRGRGRVIGVNNAGLDLCPWADVLYFADGWSRWLTWNHKRFHLFKGKYIVTRCDEGMPPGVDIKQIKHDFKIGFSDDPRQLSGFCSGANAINLAYLFGARVIVLMGFDMRPGNWHDLHRAGHKKGQHRDAFIPAIERMAKPLEEGGCVVLNTFEGSALRCFPFADIEDILSMDNIAAAEKDKYLRVWEHPEYRKISPGMLEAERALAIFKKESGSSVTDFGAGTGRATKFFKDRGYQVLAIDFAANALEEEVPFADQCLWELDIPAADFGYCCDVMEHIPPDKVTAVLKNIAEHTTKGCYFRIATRPDVMGKLVGQALHLTVNTGEWWRRQVERFWSRVDVVESNGRDVVLWARP